MKVRFSSFFLSVSGWPKVQKRQCPLHVGLGMFIWINTVKPLYNVPLYNVHLYIPLLRGMSLPIRIA